MAKVKKKSSSTKKADVEKTERHTLDWRDCKMPPSVNFRTQKHGDESVPATDIRVSEIELTKEEVETLAQEKYASRLLWANGGRGKSERPTLERFEPLRLSEPIESARVSIRVGGEEIKLGVSKLKAVTLSRKSGGVAHLSCLVQATPAINAKLASLIGGMDGRARIHIEYEHNAEQLEAFDADEAGKGADPDTKKFEDGARAQVEAFRRGTPVGDPSIVDPSH